MSAYLFTLHIFTEKNRSVAGSSWTHVVDVMKHISPKHVQDVGAHQEAAHTHPESVGEGRESEGDDEVGEERRHEDDEGFAREEIEEEPHHPGEEAARRGAEVVEPVGDDGEDEGDENYFAD